MELQMLDEIMAYVFGVAGSLFILFVFAWGFVDGHRCRECGKFILFEPVIEHVHWLWYEKIITPYCRKCFIVKRLRGEKFPGD